MLARIDGGAQKYRRCGGQKSVLQTIKTLLFMVILDLCMGE